ncbi:MAG: transposase family protein [Nitrosopumilaceae archaeon]|nr:transposase family protein [Nitrosopumilaceae archaeon]
MRVYTIMSKNARAFRTTVGMSLEQFDFLVRDVEKAHPETKRKRLDRPGRRRRPGAGRPFALHLWDRVLLVLMYYRTYLIQDGMTHLFGISQGSISANIKKMAPRSCQELVTRIRLSKK